MTNLNKIKLFILDVDGILTDGTKVYDYNHNVLTKRFSCKDFTAIKRLIGAGINVVMVSGDNFNSQMAKKRNIEFYCSRNEDLSLDKSRYVDLFMDKYNLKQEEIAFIGDDYFDLSIIKRLKYSFCPSDSPKIVKDNCHVVLDSKGGNNVIVELYDYLITEGFITDASEDVINQLDRNELTSQEMK
jgi:3-deoxy-D-manno-octulosonate 8-phosphate phosphatase (KDO 8-P phosphatase)